VMVDRYGNAITWRAATTSPIPRWSRRRRG
jgi:hypothetical protein